MPVKPPDYDQLVKRATSGIASMPAQVLSRVTSMPAPMAETSQEDLQGGKARKNGIPTTEELAAINALANVELSPDSVYVFDTSISTQRVDSYFTRMDTTSLKNYASEAIASVPVMNSHRTGGWQPAELPIGRSFAAWMEPDPQLPGLERTVVSFYILRNNEVNGVNTDQIIASIEAGVTRDVSIGFRFSPGSPENNFEDRTWYRCSVCGQDWLAAPWWSENPDDCQHWPGEVYAFDGGQQKQLCYLDVINGHLAEISTVWSGATEGAVILKARAAAGAGALNRAQIASLENVYHVRLAGAPALQKPQPTQQRKETKPAMSKEQLEEARANGQRQAYVDLLKSLLDGRSLSASEMALVTTARDAVAAGNYAKANTALAGLATTRADAEGGDMAACPECGEEVPEGETTCPHCGAEVKRAEETQEEEAVAEEEETEAATEETSTEGQASTTVSLELGLAASERQQFRALQEEAKKLRADNKKLKRDAEIGQWYREELIAGTVREAVRAKKGWDEDFIRSMCKNLDIEHIQELYQDFARQATALLSPVDEHGNPTGVGGRQTQAADPNSPFLGGSISSTPMRQGEIAAYSTRN